MRTNSVTAYRVLPSTAGVAPRLVEPCDATSAATRDQLFLALRIAALELQSEQGEPVPFIADDLFINFDDERSKAGLKALWNLSTKTQVIFLSHQEHLLPVVESLFPQVNVLRLEASDALA